jgi:hypothetical protein
MSPLRGAVVQSLNVRQMNLVSIEPFFAASASMAG